MRCLRVILFALGAVACAPLLTAAPQAPVGPVLARGPALIGAVQAAAHLAEADYAALAGRKAVARVPGMPHVVGIAHSHAADLEASQRALAECERRRATASAAPACELVRLNDTTITTGAEIRARVPSGAHPLYLWRYRSGAATVYLAGSVHVLKPSLYPLPNPVMAAFERADTLVVEVDTRRIAPGEVEREMARFALLPGGQTLSSVLPAELHARLRARLAEHGLPLEALERFNPGLVTAQLMVSQLISLGYDPGAGVEQYLLRLAGDRQVLELETPAEQFALLFGQPLDVQIALLREVLDPSYAVEPLMADIVTAWLAGDDIAFDTLFRIQTGTSAAALAFNRRLLDDRNVAMAARIAGLLEKPGEVFVLIGAAHFPGEAGIIAELARRGITGERIASDAKL